MRTRANATSAQHDSTRRKAERKTTMDAIKRDVRVALEWRRMMNMIGASGEQLSVGGG